MNRQQRSNERPPIDATIYSHDESAEIEWVDRVMAYLDRCSATFEAVLGWPGCTPPDGTMKATSATTRVGGLAAPT